MAPTFIGFLEKDYDCLYLEEETFPTEHLNHLYKVSPYMRAHICRGSESRRGVNISSILDAVDPSWPFTVIIESHAMVAAPDGTLYWWDTRSGNVVCSIPTGKPIYEAYQNKEDGDLNYYIDIGEDGKFYKHVKNSTPEKLPYGAEELIKGAQEVSHDESLLVTIETTQYVVDPKTSTIMSTINSDGSSSFGQNSALKLKKTDFGPVNRDQLLKVKRIDYTLTYRSSETEKLLWLLRYSEFKASGQRCGCHNFLGGIKDDAQSQWFYQSHDIVLRFFDPNKFQKFLFENSIKMTNAGDENIAQRSLISSHHPGLTVGKLFVPNSEIDKGGDITTLLKGTYDGRPASVKRISKVDGVNFSMKKIKLLRRVDGHTNFVRYYGKEEDQHYVYIAFEPCICSLQELMRSKTKSAETMEDLKDFEVQKPGGYPSPEFFRLMRDIEKAVARLHQDGFIHGDLKPQNVMICNSEDNKGSSVITAKVFGMLGLAKRKSHGSVATDTFDLGRLFLYCFSGGKYPFSDTVKCDMNIIHNIKYRSLLEKIPEASDLIFNLLHPNPEKRDHHHPRLWEPRKHLSFYRDASDRLERIPDKRKSNIYQAIQNLNEDVFDGNWMKELDDRILRDLRLHRNYYGDQVSDQLRAIRNSDVHNEDLSEEVQGVLGEIPVGLDDYYSRRFPQLLTEVYKVLQKRCGNEKFLQKYYKR